MCYRRVALAWEACLVALVAGCSGCTSREEMAAGEPDGGVSELEPPGLIGPTEPEFERGYRVIGLMDTFDRYPYTVSFRAVSDPEAPRYRGCAGVLLSSNLVLTAAHCVCAPSRGETIQFDGSQCAKTVEDLLAHTITSLKDGYPVWGEYEGTGIITVHPQFEIALDAQGAIVTSRADLAVIRVEWPVSPDIQPVRLATKEAKAGEVLSVVGFGYDDGWMDLWRRSIQEKVQAPAGDDRVLFGSTKFADYKGDTGGPCLRETKQGFELIGISQRGLGRAPAFTRIAPYREWLEEQIRLANGKH